MNTDLILAGENALLLVFKIGILIILLIYVLFAGVVIKQVRMMIDTLEVGFETPVKLMAFLHFLLALCILVLAVVIL